MSVYLTSDRYLWLLLVEDSKRLYFVTYSKVALGSVQVRCNYLTYWIVNKWWKYEILDKKKFNINAIKIKITSLDLQNLLYVK